MEDKLWEIKIIEIICNDLEGEFKIIHPKTLYRHGVSKKQVESRIRHAYNLYDGDNDDGSESIRYEFEINEVIRKPGFEQLSLFDI